MTKCNLYGDAQCSCFPDCYCGRGETPPRTHFEYWPMPPPPPPSLYKVYRDGILVDEYEV